MAWLKQSAVSRKRESRDPSADDIFRDKRETGGEAISKSAWSTCPERSRKIGFFEGQLCPDRLEKAEKRAEERYLLTLWQDPNKKFVLGGLFTENHPTF